MKALWWHITSRWKSSMEAFRSAMGTSMSYEWQSREQGMQQLWVFYKPESNAYQEAAHGCFVGHSTDLDHMLSFIEPLQSFALSKLEQRDLKKKKRLKPVCNIASSFHGKDFNCAIWQWYQIAETETKFPELILVCIGLAPMERASHQSSKEFFKENHQEMWWLTFGGTNHPKRYRKTTLLPKGMMSWISQNIDRECLGKIFREGNKKTIV